LTISPIDESLISAIIKTILQLDLL